jgi:hypothetical protein
VKTFLVWWLRSRGRPSGPFSDASDGDGKECGGGGGGGGSDDEDEIRLGGRDGDVEEGRLLFEGLQRKRLINVLKCKCYW